MARKPQLVELNRKAFAAGQAADAQAAGHKEKEAA
jgi:hypothetical protein